MAYQAEIYSQTNGSKGLRVVSMWSYLYWRHQYDSPLLLSCILQLESIRTQLIFVMTLSLQVSMYILFFAEIVDTNITLCNLQMIKLEVGAYISTLLKSYSLLASEVNSAMVSTVRFYDRNELYGSPDVRNCRMLNFSGWVFFVISLISIS